MTETFDAIVLAGGAAERLGGVSKPDVEIGGRRLLDNALVAVSDAREIVVVGDVEVPEGVHRTLEDPPRGGPVAGLAAGLETLAGLGSDVRGGEDASEWTVVLACDLADPLPGVGRLIAAWSHALGREEIDTDEHDGWCLTDASGRPQWLIGIHRTSALRDALARLGTPRDRSMRALFEASTLVTVPGSQDDIADIDTWADHTRWVEHLTADNTDDGKTS